MTINLRAHLLACHQIEAVEEPLQIHTATPSAQKSDFFVEKVTALATSEP